MVPSPGAAARSTTAAHPSRLGRVLFWALARATLVAGIAGALATVSLGVGVLTLTAGSVALLAWSYRRPWPVRWLSTLAPALAGAFTLAAQLALPLPALGARLAAGGSIGGVAGIVWGLRHVLGRSGGPTIANPAWQPVLLWGLGLLAGQGTSLSGEADLAALGVFASSLGGTLLCGFFLGLAGRRAFGGGRRRSPAHGISPVGLALVGILLAPSGSGLFAQSGLQEGLWSGSLDPDRKAAAVARITFAEVSYECSDVSLRIHPDGRAELQGGFSCSIVVTDGRGSGEILSSTSSYQTSYTPAGIGSTREIPVVLDVRRQARHALAGGRPPRISETSGIYERPARLEGTPDNDGVWLYVYNGADAVSIVPWRLRRSVAAEGPGTQAPPVREPEPTPDVEPPPDPDPVVDPDVLPPPLPVTYVPRHLLVEGGEQAGVLMGLAALLAGLVTSIGMGLGLGTTVVVGANGPSGPSGLLAGTAGGIPSRADRSPPESSGPPSPGSAPGGGTADLDSLLQSVRRQRIEWLASGGRLPEILSGAPETGPWAGEGYRRWRDAREVVDQAVQRNRDPDDLYDPSRLKQEEMEDYHRFVVMRNANRGLRMVRAAAAGGGDVASDTDPGFWTAITGGLHSFWDFFGPDSTNLPESFVDPQSEYRNLVETWRSSQSWSRWLRTGTPREPSDIREMIEALRSERHSEQMAHIGDDEYFEKEYPRWDEELRALRAMEEWLGRAGGDQ